MWNTLNVWQKSNIITNYKYSVFIQKLKELAFDIINQIPICNHTLVYDSRKNGIYFSINIPEQL